MKSSRVDHARPFKIALGIGFSVVILAALTVAVVKSNLNYQSKAALITKYRCELSGEGLCYGGTIVSNIYCGSTCRAPNECCRTTVTVPNTPTPTPRPSTPTPRPVTPTQMIPEASCTTTKGWKGTCSVRDRCNIVDPNIAWDPLVSPCKSLTGYGCCGKSPDGASCTTTKGWKGTCSVRARCNILDPNIAWDPLVSPCRSLTGYGCCGKYTAPTPTPTPVPCAWPNRCALLSDCDANGTKKSGKCTSGYVCCYIPVANSPTPTPVPCASPNKCVLLSDCDANGTIKPSKCTTSGYVCCLIPIPTPTPKPPTPTPYRLTPTPTPTR